MKRTAATILATLAIAAATLTPAAAATGDSPSPQPPTRHTVSTAHIPLCVTTTWRAQHTRKPKTAPGEVCQVRVGMWIPSSWVRAGVVYSRDHSQAFETWMRPAL